MRPSRRGAALRALFERIKAAQEPCYPALLCEKAGVSKTTLAKYPQIAIDVWDYGMSTWPAKMRGRRPNPRRSTVTNTKAEQEQDRLSRTVLKLRGKLRDALDQIRQLKVEKADLNAAVDLRARLLEVLIHRAAERGRPDAEDVRLLLKESLSQEAHSDAVS